MSAVAETNSSVAFIGVGETPNDLERFEADRFISRLLGMGDIKTLIERAQETKVEEEMDVEALMRGKFTLKDMCKQMEAINKMGPLKQIMQMLPLGGIGLDISDQEYQVTKDRLDKYRVIMSSMTEAELDDPKIITASRIKRISKGSGTSPELVRELLKSHKAMQKAIKGMRGMNKMGMKRMMKKFGPMMGGGM
jgi:signal recognition particle subunit FFH/SRP54 (srp54)